MRRSGTATGMAVVAILFALTTACSHAGTQSTAGTDRTSASTPAPTPASGQPAVPFQKPVPAESNPPGDIPDNTAFVRYTSKAGGFTFKVPEGWARKTTSSSTSFTSTLNGITAAWQSTSSAPVVSSARSTDVPALRASEPAFRMQSVTSVSLPAGRAVEIVFQENSKPNKVTGKQYRLVVERFEFFKDGTEVDLSLSSPVGADNVDPWRVVSESFQWT